MIEHHFGATMVRRTSESEGRIDAAIRRAVLRAAHDRYGSFAVLVDGDDVVVQDAKAARPKGARLECIAQFWTEILTTATAKVEVRWSGAYSEVRLVTAAELAAYRAEAAR